MQGNLLIVSRGIRRIAHGCAFTPEFEAWVSKKSDSHVAVGGWGYKPTAFQARAYAAKHKLPYVALEDGFLRSVRLGRDGEQPLSLVVDPVGIYYDAHQPSQLEEWLEAGTWNEPALLQRANRVRTQVVAQRLSKYNHAPDTCPWNDNVERVLVIDQTFDDMSVKGALADKASFHRMLHAALRENPAAEIVVKTHPDVLAGYREGYLGKVEQDSRIAVLADDLHPWAVLDGVKKVYVVSSLMGFEALLAGKEVRCFGMPFYAGWGLTTDEFKCARRSRACTLDEVFAAAYLKYARYVDPISGKACEIEDVIPLLTDRRRHWLNTRGKVICAGVSKWKRRFLPAFLSQVDGNVRFVKNFATGLDKASAQNTRLALWASKETEALRHEAAQREIPLIRIEDAFLRSVGLGSDLVQPGSLVLDDEGIYYDCRSPSRLETLLRETTFSDDLIQRAQKLQHMILHSGLTKYNVGNQATPGFDAKGRNLILVPGQVEDDASILRGSPEINRNLDLLIAVRRARPEAAIIYKPHPDVWVGNRKGRVTEEDALKWCDWVVTDISMDKLLGMVDEVHTMTSLTGFEALLRGKKVACYGLPFYAGWGLTADRQQCERRGRVLSLPELIAATLILYPVYVDPDSGQICTPEHFITWLMENRTQIQGPPLKTRLIRLFQNWRQGRD